MRLQRKYRQKRNFKPGIFSIILLGLVLLVIFSIFLLFRSNMFTIQSIDVQTEKISCTDNKQIRDVVPLLGQNFFLTNSAKVESKLKKRFICIKSVEILRQFPNRVKIKVFGREPAAILVVTKDIEATQSGLLERFTQQATPSGEPNSSAIVMDSGENLLVDIQGVIYSSNLEGVTAPRIYVRDSKLTLGQTLKEDVIKNVLKILDKLKTFGVSVKEVKIIQNKLLLVDAVPRIIFKLDDKQEMQIASLQLILNKAKIDDSSLEFIDLRFDKPVVRFAPKKK